MTAVSLVTGTHLLAALAAALMTFTVVLTPSRSRPDVPYLHWACGGTVIWASCVASVTHEGVHPWHQVLWFPAIAFTTGAILLWAGSFARHEWRPPRGLIVMWLAAPALILAVRLTGGEDVRPALFVVNLLYCFALLLAVAVFVARRVNDVQRGPRAVARFVLLAAFATLVAEAFRLNVTDIIVAAALLVVVATASRAGAHFRARPGTAGLLDDLGALVLVFDVQQGLVEVNAPTRLFYEARGVDTPPAGTSARDLLGADLNGLDTIAVTIVVGEESIRLSGYVQRLPSDGASPSGWVCLLRRSTRTGEERDKWARRARMARLPAHDPATGLLSERALQHALTEASRASTASHARAVMLIGEAPDPGRLARAASALAASWEGRPETIAAGRYGHAAVVLVVRDDAEASLRTWADAADALDGCRVLIRSGAVGELVVLLEAAAADVRGQVLP